MPRRYPETHVLYRNLAREYPLIVRGEGVWLYDETGRAVPRRACGGAYVACLGHGVTGWWMRWPSRCGGSPM